MDVTGIGLDGQASGQSTLFEPSLQVWGQVRPGLALHRYGACVDVCLHLFGTQTKSSPEWTHDPYLGLGYRMKHILWDFSFREVRDYKVKIIRELAEDYDFDGISIDFARNPSLFRVGTQWLNRDHLTAFMRRVRAMTLDVEKKRGRPLLTAIRVPEDIVGCHFDGIDIERWARERLADIFVLGGRSSDVDIPAFRRITAGTRVGWSSR